MSDNLNAMLRLLSNGNDGPAVWSISDKKWHKRSQKMAKVRTNSMAYRGLPSLIIPSIEMTCINVYQVRGRVAEFKFRLR